MTQRPNGNLLDKAKQAGIFYWQIADRIGVAESTFLRWIRHELPEEKQTEILQAIEEIAEEQAKA